MRIVTESTQRQNGARSFTAVLTVTVVVGDVILIAVVFVVVAVPVTLTLDVHVGSAVAGLCSSHRVPGSIGGDGGGGGHRALSRP